MYTPQNNLPSTCILFTDSLVLLLTSYKVHPIPIPSPCSRSFSFRVHVLESIPYHAGSHALLILMFSLKQKIEQENKWVSRRIVNSPLRGRSKKIRKPIIPLSQPPSHSSINAFSSPRFFIKPPLSQTAPLINPPIARSNP